MRSASSAQYVAEARHIPKGFLEITRITLDAVAGVLFPQAGAWGYGEAAPSGPNTISKYNPRQRPEGPVSA